MAFDYNLLSSIEDEEDIINLYSNGDLSEYQKNSMLFLLKNPIDLNTATKEELEMLPEVSFATANLIIGFRKSYKRFLTPNILVENGIISKKTARLIMPFIKSQPQRLSGNYYGSGETGGILGRNNWTDSSYFLSTEAGGMDFIDIGASLFIGRKLKNIELNRDQSNESNFLTTGKSFAASPELFYGKLNLPSVSIIAGTYNCSFGSGLVLSQTGTVLSDQCQPVLKYNKSIEQGKFYISDKFFGGVVTFNLFPFKDVLFKSNIFYSREKKDVYQYDISPDRVIDGDSYQKLSFQQIPDLFTEQTVGGSLIFNIDETIKFGTTAYYSEINFKSNEVSFSENSPYPDAGSFGAGGLFFSYTGNFFKGMVEFGKNFNIKNITSHDNAILAESILNFNNISINLTGRYYGKNFINPHGSSSSSADEFDGNRNRNEKGLNTRVNISLFENTFIITDFDHHSQVEGTKKQTYVSFILYEKFLSSITTRIHSSLSLRDEEQNQIKKWEIGSSLFLRRIIPFNVNFHYDFSTITNSENHEISVKISKKFFENNHVALRFKGIKVEGASNLFDTGNSFQIMANLKLNIFNKIPADIGFYYRRNFNQRESEEWRLLWEIKYSL